MYNVCMKAHTIEVKLSDGTIAEVSDISLEFLKEVCRFCDYDSVNDVTDQDVVRYVIEATRIALDKHATQTEVTRDSI